jgi:hypothetical protein
MTYPDGDTATKIAVGGAVVGERRVAADWYDIGPG